MKNNYETPDFELVIPKFKENILISSSDFIPGIDDDGWSDIWV